MSSMHNFVSALDLRKIRYMLALAEYGSFSEAALALNITQSALSRSIQSLEAALDTKLFERTTRDVVLTPAGSLSLDAARQTLTSAADFYRIVRATQVDTQHDFSVGMGNVMASVFGPLLLRRFTRDHPELSLSLKVDAPENLYEQLLTEDIDVVIGTTETMPDRPHFRAENVGSFRRGFFARMDHPLAGEKQIDISAIHTYAAAISFPLPEKVVRAIERTYAISSLKDLFQTKSNHHEALLDLMLNSDTVVFGASIAYLSQIKAGHIVQLDVHPVFPDDMPLTVTHMAGRSLPKAAESLTTILHEWCARS